MPDLVIELHLSAGQLLQYYRGTARNVQARAVTGQLVQFPAAILQKHVTKEGVHGQFRLRFDENHKFVGLEPLQS